MQRLVGPDQMHMARFDTYDPVGNRLQAGQQLLRTKLAKRVAAFEWGDSLGHGVGKGKVAAVVKPNP